MVDVAVRTKLKQGGSYDLIAGDLKVKRVANGRRPRARIDNSRGGLIATGSTGGIITAKDADIGHEI